MGTVICSSEAYTHVWVPETQSYKPKHELISKHQSQTEVASTPIMVTNNLQYYKYPNMVTQKYKPMLKGESQVSLFG